MPKKKLSSRDIEARIQKIRDEILALNERLHEQKSEAALSFDSDKFSVTKSSGNNFSADVTIWLGHGLE